MPSYIKLNFAQRTLGNKCQYSLYRLLRVFFVSFWFYYAPFLALLFNFIVPLFIKKEFNNANDGSSMGADYEKWLADNLAKETESDYVEPGV